MSETAADNEWQQWFEAIWADREENLYRRFFGDIGRGIYTLTAGTFKQLGQESFDPRLLFHGVFECPPTEARPHWVYVSSGMSNPWGEKPGSIPVDGYSGLGFEFTLHTAKPGRWALELVQWLMAVQLLVAAGELEGGLVEYHNRIKFRKSPGDDAAAMTKVLITPPPGVAEPGGYPEQFELASGKVDFMMMLTISEREADFARTQNPEALINLLRHHEIFPLSDLSRLSTV